MRAALAHVNLQGWSQIEHHLAKMHVGNDCRLYLGVLGRLEQREVVQYNRLKDERDTSAAGS